MPKPLLFPTLSIILNTSSLLKKIYIKEILNTGAIKDTKTITFEETAVKKNTITIIGAIV